MEFLFFGAVLVLFALLALFCLGKFLKNIGVVPLIIGAFLFLFVSYCFSGALPSMISSIKDREFSLSGWSVFCIVVIAILPPLLMAMWNGFWGAVFDQKSSSRSDSLKSLEPMTTATSGDDTPSTRTRIGGGSESTGDFTGGNDGD